MKLPRITIVTPSFNQDRFLEQAILSVLGQNYPDLEYIVMDGGSSDGSVAIIRKYADRLVHWESHPDAGQADAIHRGFVRATGEVLGWLNSDDLLFPGALMKAGHFFSTHPRVDCIVGASLIIDSMGEVKRSGRGWPIFTRGSRETYRKLLLMERPTFEQPASFWRREAFFRVGGFDTGLRYAFDFDMYLRMARERPLEYLPEFLACFRVHPDSKGSNMRNVCLSEDAQILASHGKGARSGWLDRIQRRWYDRCDKWRGHWSHLKLRLGLLQLPAAPRWE